MTEIQSISITQYPWFDEYRKICVNNELIQKAWKPAIGDWFERHYHMDLSPLSIIEEKVVEMVCYKSTARGYWHVTTADGRSTVWNSEEELLKGTAKWIPRLDQLIGPICDSDGFEICSEDLVAIGDINSIHMGALKRFIMSLEIQEMKRLNVEMIASNRPIEPRA